MKKDKEIIFDRKSVLHLKIFFVANSVDKNILDPT